MDNRRQRIECRLISFAPCRQETRDFRRRSAHRSPNDDFNHFKKIWMPMPVFSILSRLPGVKGSSNMIRNVIAFTLITLPLATGISLGQEFRNTTATLAARSDASRVQVKELQSFRQLAQ